VLRWEQRYLRRFFLPDAQLAEVPEA